MSVPVYCECRQLESEKMVKCDQCQDWFDNDYVTVYTILFKKEKILVDSINVYY